VSTCAEVHVLPAKGRDLAIPEARLNRDEQKGLIPPSDPCGRIGSCDKGGGLFLCQKLHWATLVTLRRDRKDTLTLQGECWFTDRYVSEEGVYRGQTVVSRTRAVATVEFEVFEELPQEGNIEVFHGQFGRRPSKTLGGELEQQTEGISVSRYGVLACAELLYQPLSEETLNEGLKAGNTHRSPPG